MHSVYTWLKIDRRLLFRETFFIFLRVLRVNDNSPTWMQHQLLVLSIHKGESPILRGVQSCVTASLLIVGLFHPEFEGFKVCDLAFWKRWKRWRCWYYCNHSFVANYIANNVNIQWFCCTKNAMFTYII